LKSSIIILLFLDCLDWDEAFILTQRPGAAQGENGQRRCALCCANLDVDRENRYIVDHDIEP
jgi:hypothetical protein